MILASTALLKDWDCRQKKKKKLFRSLIQKKLMAGISPNCDAAKYVMINHLWFNSAPTLPWVPSSPGDHKGPDMAFLLLTLCAQALRDEAASPGRGLTGLPRWGDPGLALAWEDGSSVPGAEPVPGGD